jgi:hypothetical protein
MQRSNKLLTHAVRLIIAYRNGRTTLTNSVTIETLNLKSTIFDNAQVVLYLLLLLFWSAAFTEWIGL